ALEGPRLLEDHRLAGARDEAPRPLEAWAVRRDGMRHRVLIHKDHGCSAWHLERRRRELEGLDRDRHRRRDMLRRRRDRRSRTGGGPATASQRSTMSLRRVSTMSISSFFSAAGALYLSRASERWPTTMLNSALVIPSPACVVFAVRLITLH